MVKVHNGSWYVTEILSSTSQRVAEDANIASLCVKPNFSRLLKVRLSLHPKSRVLRTYVHQVHRMVEASIRPRDIRQHCTGCVCVFKIHGLG